MKPLEHRLVIGGSVASILGLLYYAYTQHKAAQTTAANNQQVNLSTPAWAFGPLDGSGNVNPVGQTGGYLHYNLPPSQTQVANSSGLSTAPIHFATKPQSPLSGSISHLVTLASRPIYSIAKVTAPVRRSPAVTAKSPAVTSTPAVSHPVTLASYPRTLTNAPHSPYFQLPRYTGGAW